MANSSQSRRAIFVSHLFAAAALLLFSASAARAQSNNPSSSTTSAMTPAGMSPGSPAGTYALSGFDNVNLFNGNLNFRLPLLTIGGRGAAGYTMTLAASTKKWQVKTDTVLSGFCTPDWDIDPDSGIPIEKLHCGTVENGDRFIPQWKQWNTVQVGYGPGVIQGRKTGVGTVSPCNRTGSLYRYTLTRLTFISPDGTEYELRDEATGGKPMPVEQARCFDASTVGAARGKRFVSSDGSAMTFVSDGDIYDDVRVQTGSLGAWLFGPSGVLYMRDGTSYRIDNGGVSWIRDRDGNQVTFSTDSSNVTTITDAPGRTVTVEYDLTDGTYGKHDRITYHGFGGEARVLRVSKSRLSQALRAPYAVSTYQQLFPPQELNGSLGFSGSFDPEVVSAVWLPDGRKYRLLYNSYAEVARVELPTGGATEYDMVAGSGVVVSSGATARGIEERQIYRRLKESRIYTGLAAGTLVSRTVYTAGDGTSEFNGTTVRDDHVVKVEQYDGANHLLALSKHYFVGSAADSLFTREEGSLYSPAGEGREITTVSFDTVDTSKTLHTVTSTWEQREPVAWVGHLESWGSNFPPPGLAIQPDNDPRQTRVLTTLDDGQVTKQEFDYDRYNNRKEMREYGYGQGQPGGLLRRTVTEYLTTDPSSGVDYAGATSGAHIRNLPLSTEVWDGSADKLVSRSEFVYDEAARLSDDYGTLPADFPGYSAPATTARGHLTTAKSWLDMLGAYTSPQTYLETHAQYDRFGNAVKAWDARGNVSEVKFSAQYRYAYPTGTVSADPDGASGPLSPLTASTVYDFTSGAITDTYGANGEHTHADYETGPNKLDRLKKVTRPDGGWTEYEYGDDPGNLYLRTRTLREAAPVERVVEGYQFFDGLGRAVRSTSMTGETTWSAAATEYDGAGRVVRVTNPYESSNYTGTVPQGALWTTTEYDALGRAWKVTSPDGAKAVTHFDGPRTLATDQAGVQRLSKTDALGRLAEVWEVRAADAATGTEAVTFPHNDDVPDVAAGYKTGYGYDVLGNLRKVEQGGQRRYFAYDSLSRLLRVKNPEQESLDALQLPTGLVSPLSDNNNGWSLKYEYDENGNQKKRVDARGVETSYAYDALNRITDRSYTAVPLPQGGTISTPPVKYYYDDQQLPAGAPAFTRGKSLGRLVAVTYGGAASATGSYTGDYDGMGRARYGAQVTITQDMSGQSTAQTYAFGYEYHLDGSLKSETYPSGRVTVSEYDAAGRLAGVKNQGGGYYAGGDPTVPGNPNVIAYTAHGAVAAMSLGNGLWEHTRYNNRLQVAEIGLGTLRTDSSLLKLEYGYGVPTAAGTPDPTKNNGSVSSQRISVPAAGQTPAQTFTQTYTYDALNRLGSAAEANGSGQTWTEGYAYDRFGNRGLVEAQTKRLNSQAQLVAAVDDSNRAVLNPTISTTTNRVSQAGYDYDAAGNMKCDPQHACGPQPAQIPYFAYDGENRIVAAGGAPQTGGAGYEYDGDGRRVKTVAGAVATVFVNDGAGRLAAEYSNQVQYGGTSYVTQDALGSTRVVTGQGQEVRGRYDYRPFGEEVAEGRGGYGGGSVRQKFAGYERDEETGLDYAQARHYTSARGRFTSVDPLMASGQVGNPQTFNRYSYVLNNPLNVSDPTGMCPDCPEDLDESDVVHVADSSSLSTSWIIRMGQRWYDYVNGLFDSGWTPNSVESTFGVDLLAHRPTATAVASGNEAAQKLESGIQYVPLWGSSYNALKSGHDYNLGHASAAEVGLNTGMMVVDFGSMAGMAGGVARGGASKGPLRVALGISENGELANFARQRNATTYGEYFGSNLFDEGRFAHLMDKADEIHFNTNRFDFHNFGRWALRDGELNFFRGTTTNWELQQVLINEAWRAKLIF
jgi:RHS repeat-associated protein